MNMEAYFKITYGLYVVSSAHNSRNNGFISNTVFQVTAEPPRIAIACNKNNFTADLIKNSGFFSISVLEQETRPEIISVFGYKSGKDTDKFANFKFLTGKSGVPVLFDDSIAYFECEVEQTFDVNTHLLFIGKIIDFDLLDQTKEPLTYAYYREVKKGKAPKNAPTYIPPESKSTTGDIAKPKYVCATCGYEYIPEKGDMPSGIPQGTPFEKLPENWVCPVCGAAQTDFAIKK